MVSSDFGIGSCSGRALSVRGSDDTLALATGRVWAPAIMPLALCCILYGCVLGFCILIHLH